VALTSDYGDVQRSLDRVLQRGPEGSTHIQAGVNQATIELLGFRGAFSRADPQSEKLAVFLTDGQPTLPCGPAAEACNVEAVIGAAQLARRGGVRFFTFGIGAEALAGPLAIVRLAEITGGAFTPVRDPADLASVVDQVDFANLDDLSVRNVTSGEAAQTLSTSPDGGFSALVPLKPGKNVIEVKGRASDGEEATARVVVSHAPGAPDAPLPEALIASRNQLLEKRLVELKRARLEVEERRSEETRKQLEVEIEQEREKARERAEAQRKALELRVEKPPAEVPPGDR
jgi:hypothetical protein